MAKNDSYAFTMYSDHLTYNGSVDSEGNFLMHHDDSITFINTTSASTVVGTLKQGGSGEHVFANDGFSVGGESTSGALVSAPNDRSLYDLFCTFGTGGGKLTGTIRVGGSGGDK